MKQLGLLVLISFLFVSTAFAQYTSQKEAVYMATIKAVVDYKINDEENLKKVEELRQDERFKKDLLEMLGKLSNRRSKNSVNNRVYKILLKAGKDIYNELN